MSRVKDVVVSRRRMKLNVQCGGQSHESRSCGKVLATLQPSEDTHTVHMQILYEITWIECFSPSCIANLILFDFVYVDNHTIIRS